MTTTTTVLPELPARTERAPRAPIGRLVRSELRLVFRRPRTLVGIGLLAVAPIAIGIGTLFATRRAAGAGTDGPPFTSLAGNGLTLPVIALGLTMVLLLPLLSSVAAADALAGEASAGTLRGLLLAPVSRPRLLAVKATGVAAVVAVAVAVMTAVAVVTGLVLNGTDRLVTLSGSTIGFGDALGRVLLAAGWVLVQMLAVCAVALAVSACTEHPLVVLTVVVGGMIVIGLLSNIPALDWLQPFLLTSSWGTVADVLQDPVPTTDLTTGLLRALCYVVIGYSLAQAKVATKDG